MHLKQRLLFSACLVVVSTVGAAVWVWPKVIHWIVGGVKGVSQSHTVVKVISELVSGYIKLISHCLQMGGDIGGFAAGCVLILGGALLIASAVIISFGTPLLPGIALTWGGVSLWNYADKFEK